MKKVHLWEVLRRKHLSLVSILPFRSMNHITLWKQKRFKSAPNPSCIDLILKYKKKTTPRKLRIIYFQSNHEEVRRLKSMF